MACRGRVGGRDTAATVTGLCRRGRCAGEPERGGPRHDMAQRSRSRQDAVVRTRRYRNGATGTEAYAMGSYLAIGVGRNEEHTG